MSWHTIRLELARTPDHPQGSSAHAYELVLPLGADGLIDRAAFAKLPGRASFQRAWAGEPVVRGAILRHDGAWSLSYAPGESDDEQMWHLADHPLTQGAYITLVEPDGARLPYRVVRVRALP